VTAPEFTTEELEREEWRDIPGYPGYQISSLGRFKATRKSKKTGSRICQPPIEDGYYRVSLYYNGRAKHFGIHRLVAMAFLGQPQEYQTEINHCDTNKLNNRLNNLEYCTRAQNAEHAAANGLLSKGTKHGELIKAKTPRGGRNAAAKLTEAQVKDIRENWHRARGEARRVAQVYGVDRSLIQLIVKRLIWTHI